MKHIMTYAWKKARKGAEKFGGSPVEYLSEALKMAWARLGKKHVKPVSKKAKLTTSAGSRKHKSWVAEITGTHSTYKYNRKFVESVDSNMMERYFELSKGVYEVCDAGERYFIRVANGKIDAIGEQDVVADVA